MASIIRTDKIGPVSGSVDLTLPTADGSAKSALITDGSKALSFATGTPSASNFLRGDGTWAAAGGLFSSYAVIEDQKTSGTDGGTFSSGAWRTRDLNTEVVDTDGIVSISANRFTLLTGSYLIKWFATALEVNEHISALYDVTGTAYIEYGSSEDTQPTISCTSKSIGTTRVTVAASPGTNQYEIQHRCNSTEATHGFGRATSNSVESYCLVEIYKEA